MMFLFKKSKIVVDCFTYFDAIHDLFKIRRASSFYPEEIKNLSKTYDTINQRTNIKTKASTIKKCHGIKDLYTNGAVIPLWTDIISQPRTYIQGKSAPVYIPEIFPWNQHYPEQAPGMFNEQIHIKLASVWHIREKTGINFVWQGAYWNQLKHLNNFSIPPGIVNYKHQCSTSLNILINKFSEDFTIKAGMPIVHLIPLTEKEVEYRCHLVSMDEFMRPPINVIPQEFHFNQYDRYSDHIKYKKEAEELDKKEKSKCPFGFGK